MEVSPDTFDICGDDIYSVKEYDHSSQKQRFEYMTELAHGKMITLSECGYIPDPDEMKKDNAMWLWWLPWWGEFVYKREGYKPVFDKDGYTVINEKYMTEDFMKRVMAHPDVIMREELPWYDKDKHKLPDALSANLERIKSK